MVTLFKASKDLYQLGEEARSFDLARLTLLTNDPESRVRRVAGLSQFAASLANDGHAFRLDSESRPDGRVVLEGAGRMVALADWINRLPDLGEFSDVLPIPPTMETASARLLLEVARRNFLFKCAAFAERYELDPFHEVVAKGEDGVDRMQKVVRLKAGSIRQILPPYLLRAGRSDDKIKETIGALAVMRYEWNMLSLVDPLVRLRHLEVCASLKGLIPQGLEAKVPDVYRVSADVFAAVDDAYGLTHELVGNGEQVLGLS